MNILHITDFHLDDSYGKAEALRKGFYREFLYDLILEAKSMRVDKVFITGDIVNKYKDSNYPHAIVIIDYLCEMLALERTDVFLANGNHDLDYKTGENQAYKEFSNDINAHKECIKTGKRYSLFKVNSDLILCLDSIGANYETGYPSCIDDLADDIIDLVSEHLSGNVFVLSHHPVISKDAADYAAIEEKDWHEKHLWHSGNILLKRLSNPAINKKKVFWFAGDIHLPEHTVIDTTQIHFTTGSLYLVANSNDGKTLPQARIVTTENHEVSYLCNYKIKNFQATNLIGTWTSESIQAVLQTTSNNKHKELDEVQVETKVSTNLNNANYSFKSLSSELDKDIYQHVKSKNLCKFGNLIEKDGLASLSWISITGLFQEQIIYSQVVQNFRDKIKSIVDSSQFDTSEYMLVGIDNWGAILSSRIGSATNIYSCSIAVGNNELFHIEEEVVNQKLKDILRTKKGVFILTDVISTGRTLMKIVEELEISSNVPIHIFSIFFDNNQERTLKFKMFHSRFTACSLVRLPIMESSKLL